MKEQIEEMEKAKMFFMTTDSEFIKYNGTEVEIIRPLTDKECDIEDVGNMYKARFYDGYERDVFEDELINKTIYDIATKICSNFNDGICCVDGSTCILNCEYNLLANQLYNAGYRKQEWISVEDRLPEVASKLLLFSPSDGINLGCMTEDKRFYVYKSYPDRPTHWMPLPEPPKMKGGAE